MNEREHGSHPRADTVVLLHDRVTESDLPSRGIVPCQDQGLHNVACLTPVVDLTRDLVEDA
jgi:hypothetical protein